MQESIIITASNDTTIQFGWGFCQTATKQLDYCGKTRKVPPENWQALDASPFFSPAWYSWLPAEMCAQLKVHIAPEVSIPDAGTFAYLTHIGALLLAVELNDGLLAAELLDLRCSTFMLFPALTSFVLKDIAPQALFAWIYGRFSDDEAFRAAYFSESQLAVNTKDTGAILFAAAREKLQPKPQSESPAQMFVRYFKENPETELTLGIVGANYRRWAENALDFVNRTCEQNNADDFLNDTQLVRSARNRLFAALKASVQAEPYNPHDANAIGVMLEDVPSKFALNGGIVRAGYIRATGAEILQKAHPEKYSYKANLARLGNLQDGKSGIVLRICV